MDDCGTPGVATRRASLRSMSEQRSLEQNLIDIKPQASEEARNNMGDNKGVGPSLVNGSVGVKDPLGYHRKREINRISPSQVQPRKKSRVLKTSKKTSSSRFAPLIPLRRSKREKRLIFANFTPQEIDNTIQNRSSLMVESSDEELEPYEKLLSPLAKRRYRPTASRYSLRGLCPTDDTPTSSGGNIEETENKETEIKEEKEIQGEEQVEEEEEEEEEEEDEETGYYNLRKRRPVVYQYQPVIQVVEESPHKKQKNKMGEHSFSYHHRSTGNGPSAYQVQIHRPSTLRHKTHQGSSTSSSGEDSDEARFQRRKKRSMKRSRSECLPMNFTHEDIKSGVTRDRVAIGASLADINPMSIDRETSFASIGGLTGHIRSLKEMIVFPLLYPEVFETFHISPPRGVLFHGPPGCGKTLVARALANECSKEGRKVAFFMRKGADCLSKWVGESERQLRLLFDQAYQMRPSIIFFDEIDGLAPVRSTRQDQIHSSIVSTLLALMDGLDSRGEIVVIGATNRIDAIDPALRRPGRFDREFRFPLPSREDRCSILQIHTRHWSPPLKLSFIQELADQTVGYCGADLKSLCTEAALHSLRSHYPQIYNSSQKLVIDASNIKLSASNFSSALRSIVPTAQRSTASPASPLSDVVLPLLCEELERVLNALLYVFPSSWKGIGKTLLKLKRESERLNEKEKTLGIAGNGVATIPNGMRLVSGHSKDSFSFQKFKLNDQIENVFFDLDVMVADHAHSNQSSITQEEGVDCGRGMGGACLDFTSHPHSLPSVFRPRLLLLGRPGMGQSDHIAPAILNTFEDVSIHVLDHTTIYSSTTRSCEESMLQLFREAGQSSPSVVFIPRLVSWWEGVSESLQSLLVSVIKGLPHSLSVLVLATAECTIADVPPLLSELFSPLHSCITIQSPSLRGRTLFLHDILIKRPNDLPPTKPVHTAEVQLAELPVAPPPPPKDLTDEEIKVLSKQRQAVLRELRVFLRDATNKLLAERKFKEFTKPVDIEEVPDYFDIIKSPMDLSSVMKKIDEHRYNVPKEWLDDIDLITFNALEYNPEHDPDSRLLRHRAVALQDLAHSILDHDLSEEFEKQCNNMQETFQRIEKEDPSTTSSLHKTSSTGSTLNYVTSHATPAGCTSSSKLKLTSSTASSEPTRRSLRKMGITPESEGFPYYSPTKLRSGSSGAIQQQGEEAEEEGSNLSASKQLQHALKSSTTDPKTSHVVECLNGGGEGEGGMVARRLSFQGEASKKQSQSIVNDVHLNSCSSVSLSSMSSAGETDTIDHDNVTVTMEEENGRGGDAREESERIQTVSPPTIHEEMIVDNIRLKTLFDNVLNGTGGHSVDSLLELYSHCSHIIFRHRMKSDKTQLIQDLEKCCDLFLCGNASK